MKSQHLNIEEIKKIIPQREPFLFVDEIIEVVPYKSVIGKKTFFGTEDFFKGHFPGIPVLPGVIIVETVAQISSFIVLIDEVGKNLIGLFAGIEKFRFIKRVTPAATLTVKATLLSYRHNLARSEGKVFVNENLSAEGIVSAFFVSKEA